MYDPRKYNPENKTVRSVQEIRDGLINHPDNADRKEELELLIDWLLAKEQYNNEVGRALAQAFDAKMGGEESPSLRALSLVAELEGVDEIYRTSVDPMVVFKRDVLNAPIETQIRFREEWLAVLQVCPIIGKLPSSKDSLYFDLSGIYGNAAKGVEDEAEAFIEKNFVSHYTPSNHLN